MCIKYIATNPKIKNPIMSVFWLNFCYGPWQKLEIAEKTNREEKLDSNPVGYFRYI